jgi:hypothetical protein
MKQIRTFSDERLDSMCSYCGNFPQTRDHVPSKILLDEPFPENLPIVPCCSKCNQDFSLDEEYFACAIECIIHGTTEIDKLKREKVKSILARKDILRQRIEDSFVLKNGKKYFQFEKDRFENVIIKLAKGHAKFENSEPQFEIPTRISMNPLFSMKQNEVETFFAPMNFCGLPEVGSRGLQKLLIDNNNAPSQWTDVQADNYKYSISVGLGTLIVKIIIWNYLAIEVIWEN